MLQSHFGGFDSRVLWEKNKKQNKKTPIIIQLMFNLNAVHKISEVEWDYFFTPPGSVVDPYSGASWIRICIRNGSVFRSFLDPDPNWAKILDPDPDPNSMYMDPQH